MAVLAETGKGCKPSVVAGALSHRIPSLDGIRAVAVLLVIFNHLGVRYAPEGRGVLTFFVLSGFLITWTLLKESDRSGRVSIRNFYIRRGLRIFPAFYVFWALHFVVSYFMHGKLSASVIADYATAFFYLRNYRHAISPHTPEYLGHIWALSIEEQFYFLWPWLFALLQKDLRRLTYILIGLIVAVDLYRIILFFGFHISRQWLIFAFDCRVDHLLVGCLLAVLLKRGVVTRFWDFMISRIWISAIVFGLIVASSALDLHYGTAYKSAVGFVVDPILTAVLLVQVIAFADSWMWGWLNWKTIRYVGRISYSMFLYQGVTNYWASHIFPRPSALIVLALAIALALLVGSMSYYAIEARFLRLKSKFIREGNRRHESPASGYPLVFEREISSAKV